MKWHHAYFLLAAFVLFTVSLSLFLNHRLLVTHTHTVQVNLQWVARISQIDTLAKDAGVVATSGSDMLDGHDAERESFRMTAALADFDKTFGALRNDIRRNVSPRDTAAILNDCASVEKVMGALVLRTESIFSLVGEGKHDIAVAEATRKSHDYDDVLRALDHLRVDLRARRKEYLDAQLADAAKLANFEWLLGGLILLMVTGVTVYGVRLERHVSASEAQLREADHKYRRLVEQSSDGIISADSSGNVLFANRAACEMVGYPLEEFLRLSTADTYLPEDRALSARRIQELPTGDTVCFERTVLRKDGTCFPAEIILCRVEDGWYQAIVRDITVRKRLEQQLLQSQKVEAIGRLAGGIAHDFNNILTTVIGYCALTREQLSADSDARANIEEIAAAAERAASLTRQLLAFSRKQTLQPKVLDLNAVVGNLDKMLCRLIGEDVELVTKLASDLGRVKADPGQIEQVIMNLAVNARDAMPNGGKLIVETANTTLHEEYVHVHEDVKPGDYVMLAITDTGHGMTDEVKARLFEPFFTTKPQGQGTGLGLATCYGVIKQSGGHLNVYSELNRGTTFKIYLPRISDRAAAIPTTPDATTACGGNETILLVEDDHAVRGLNALSYSVSAARKFRSAV